MCAQIWVFQNYQKNGNQISLAQKNPPPEEERVSGFHQWPIQAHLKSARRKCAGWARIPAASPRHTKARRSCLPYGTQPWSCKIISLMAACAGCSLPSRARNAAFHHSSGRHATSVKSGILKQASVLQSSGPSRPGPSMSDKPSRINTEGARAFWERQHRLRPC